MRRSSHGLAGLPGLLAFMLLAGAGGRARADWYTYVDDEGVPHYTNVEPPRTTKSRWKVYATGPGKAMSVSGASSSGCKVSRADVVPARDRSKERFTRYDAYIAEAANLYLIPEALIRAVIKVESDYDPNVVSCAAAKGLMQVMPYEITSERIEHVFDPRENIFAGTRMLRSKANHWNTRGKPGTFIDIDGTPWHQDLVLTIASYHAGVGAVTKYKGIPPYETTQKYVRWVLKQYDKYKRLEMAKRGAPGSPAVAAPAEVEGTDVTEASAAQGG